MDLESQQSSLHLQFDSEKANSIDLNATWDYEDQSLMDTDTKGSLLNSSKRNRSDSQNSDTVV